MSATTAAAAAAPPHIKPTKILACVHCQYRKIKCDRQQPCSNCIKAKIACKPSTPAPPHKRRRPNQDLLERLARCEQLLKQYADGNVPAQVEPSFATAAASGSNSIASSQPVSPLVKVEKERMPKGKVVKEDGNDRFMDNYIRISFHDELAAMRNIIDDGDDESESSTAGLSPDNDADLFLGIDDTTIDLQELQPNLVNVFRLWQIFHDRVNPLTKIIHVPTVQSIVMNAADDIKQVPLSQQALLFSIYTMAIVSLSSQEVVQILSMTREEALTRFIRGTKLALTRANFMRNYNMTILQALALYMLSLNNRSTESHSNWIMGGTVMRIAHKMGYHRDGEQFNLSPFEAEMRRRIWWHIHVQDIKNAMLSGLSHSWVTTNWDTKMPLNINDSDLIPDSMEPLVARDGPTDMVFVLIIYHYQKFNSRTHPAFEAAFLSFRAGVGNNHPPGARGPIETYRALIDEIDAELAEFERKYVDPKLGGVQEAASIIRPMFIDKMKDIMTPMHEQPEWGLEIFDQIDSLFKAFVETHKRNVLIYKRMANSGFLWLIRGGFQLDALLLFTIKLYKRPTGKLTDDAWAAMESLHDIHPDLFDLSQKKIDRQAQLTLKAWAIRERALAQHGQQVETPGFIQRLRQLVSLSRAPSIASTSSESPASMAQQFLLQQTTPFPQMPLDLGDMNQFLGNNMDTPNISLDMWGNITMDNEADTQQQALPYGGFDFSKLDFSTMDFMR
ncbi:hypothetical protein RRF57_006038 [Xylaria bambusicola]|uniref:Zn(2)-C6 fungal-type domain-containing protein n=1 Tax=Xylaria bambusicola TaxID=326684 RepID=A0AAN7Z8I8_9PEZI